MAAAEQIDAVRGGHWETRDADGPEDDFGLHVAHVRRAEFDDLVESFLPHAGSRLHEQFVLVLDGGPAYGPLTAGVAFQAGFERDIKEQGNDRHVKSSRQFEQVLAGGRSQRSRIHHAEPVDTQPLFHQKMKQRKSLGLVALVTLIVADEGARLIGRNDLRGPEMLRRES